MDHDLDLGWIVGERIEGLGGGVEWTFAGDQVLEPFGLFLEVAQRCVEVSGAIGEARDHADFGRRERQRVQFDRFMTRASENETAVRWSLRQEGLDDGGAAYTLENGGDDGIVLECVADLTPGNPLVIGTTGGAVRAVDSIDIATAHRGW